MPILSIAFIISFLNVFKYRVLIIARLNNNGINDTNTKLEVREMILYQLLNVLEQGFPLFVMLTHERSAGGGKFNTQIVGAIIRLNSNETIDSSFDYLENRYGAIINSWSFFNSSIYSLMSIYKYE